MAVIFGSLLICVLVTLAIFIYRKRKRQHEVFKKMGMPGPEPHWLFGNLSEIRRKFAFRAIQDWTAIYGRTYGYYKGPIPVIVSSDPDFLQEIFIKQFSVFHSRELFAIGPDPEKDADIHLFLARGNRWKRLRSIIVPTFSASKIKQMFPLLQRSIEIFEKKLEEASKNESINIHQYFQGLTLQVIGECAFGLEVESQTNMNDPFLIHCKKVFDRMEKASFIIQIADMFPELRKVLWAFVMFRMKFGNNNNAWFNRMFRKVVGLRKDSKEKQVDLLQLMLDSESPDTLLSEESMWASLEDNVSAEGASKEEPKQSKPSHKALTTKEIEMNCILFLIAGYETSSTALAYCSYVLSKHPDVQTKLQKEIDQTFKPTEELSYDKINSMVYLDMVLKETLRMYPVAPAAQVRMSMEPSNVKGYDIPAGVVARVDTLTLHYDPDLWGPTDPNLFEPERCSKESLAGRHPMAWIPFGAGPRNCVGMRFALAEAKLALVTLMRKFSLEKSDKQEEPLILREAFTITPKNGVFVRLTPR